MKGEEDWESKLSMVKPKSRTEKKKAKMRVRYIRQENGMGKKWKEREKWRKKSERSTPNPFHTKNQPTNLSVVESETP